MSTAPLRTPGSEGFLERAFRPLPLLGNSHLQTILGQLARAPRPAAPTRVHRVPLEGGDALLLHDSVPPGWRCGDPVALMVHGLGGSALSGYCLRLAGRFLAAGVRAVRADLRGAGEGIGLSRGAYHAGQSADLRCALAALGEVTPGSPLYLVALSLGGNAALKMAGELGDSRSSGVVAGPARLAGLAVLAPPIDLTRSTRLLEEPRNAFYQLFYVRLLALQARARQQHFTDLPPLAPELGPLWPLGVSPRLTMRRLDTLYTAPRSGFTSAEDYYLRSSSAPWLRHIDVPTLVVTSRDDPFIDEVPFLEVREQLPARVTLRIFERGGHAGFLGGDGRGSIHFGEGLLADWVLEQARRGL